MTRTPQARDLLAVPPDIQARLTGAGLRRTLAVRAVLGLFLAHSGSGFSHAQILRGLAARGHHPDRVTIYRLLDRLVACGVLQRHSDVAVRGWRFSLADGGKDLPQPMFECMACHTSFRLPQAGATYRAWCEELRGAFSQSGCLGPGFEVTVHGTCSACASDVRLPGWSA